MKFNNVWQVVEPKRKARDQANEELSAARAKLTELRSMINVRTNDRARGESRGGGVTNNDTRGV